jgi:putative SOS response-associated peptidase YedK
MPVVLSPDAYTAWLDPALEDGAAVKALATNAAITDFEAYPVSTFVNAPRNQGEECIRGLEQ